MAALDIGARQTCLRSSTTGTRASIITSQLPIEHWHGWIGDATIADTILDRLMQHMHRITPEGDSLRCRPRSTEPSARTAPRVPVRDKRPARGAADNPAPITKEDA